jgi:hypothetical protein
MPDIFASAFGASTLVAAGRHGTIYKYPEGKVYTDPAGRFIQGIVFSGSDPVLPQFVAVGWPAADTPPILLTSPDGLIWTERTAPDGTESLFAVTYGNGLYAAVGERGSLITSPDGINWTARASGTTEQLRGVTRSISGLFVAVGQNRTVLTSMDGVTWSPQTAPAGIGSDLNAVAHDGTQFIAVSSGQGIMTSPDGVNWTQQSVPNAIPGGSFESVTVGFFSPTVVVGSNRIYGSMDGITWELRLAQAPVPANGEGRNHQTVTWTPIGYAALGLGGSAFLSSSDAITWSSLTQPASREWNEVAFGNGTFCAVGANGAIASSPDGQSWVNQSGPSDFQLAGNAIAWGEDPGEFVAVSGINARIHASSDCVSFETVSHGDGFTPATGITGSLVDVVYGAEDGLFVAVGREETDVGTGLFVPLVATSSDGLSWAQVDTGAPADGVRNFDNVGYGGGRFVATGLNMGDGARHLYTSEDGIGWDAQTSPFDAFERINDITFAGGVFVAVGDRIWSSPDGITWTPRVDFDPAQLFPAVGFGDGRFVVSRLLRRLGSGSFFVSADGVNWEEHPGASPFDQRGIAFSPSLNRFVAVGESIIVRTDDPILSFSPSTYDVTEGTLTRNVTVTRTGPLTSPVGVDYATIEETALAGQDYTAKAGRLTIGAGQSSGTIAIPILNDTVDEIDETFSVTLSNPPAGIFLGVDWADVHIHDNDNGGTIELGVESLQVTEGKLPVKAKVSVIRAGTPPLAGGVGVTFSTFSGTATPGEDYTEVIKTLTFPAGATTVSTDVEILPDTLDENDEVFGVKIVGESEGAELGELTTALIKIVDDDSGGSFQFLAPTYGGTEGMGSGQLLIKVQRTGGLAAASVELVIDSGTATLGDDFTLTPGVLNFAGGQTLATAPLVILNDSLGEPMETLTLKLQNPTGGATIGARSTTLVSFKDNEPAVQFALGASTALESAGSVKVNVTRTAGPGPVTVDYGVVGGNAVSPDDFGPVGGSLSFATSELVKILTIPIVNDGEGEGLETFVLGLSNPGGASIGAKATTTIGINDNEPALRFALAAASVLETAGSVKVRVSRTPGPGPVSVDYGVIGGTALSPDDFGPVSGSLSFAGSELFKDVTIPIVNDTLGEGEETIVLGLSNPGGGYIGTPASVNVTIKDNEPVVQFGLATYKALETAGSVKVVVSRTPGPGPISVDYGITGGTASSPADFGPAAGTLLFATNELSKQLTIPIVNDTEGEGNETFVLGLSSPSGASIGARSSTTVTIGDSEPSVKLSIASYPAVSEAGATHVATFTVMRVGNLAVPFTVDYRTEDGTAEAALDYLPTSGTLSFAAKQVSQKVNVTLLDDDLAETVESIRVILENPVGASLGSIAEAVLNVASNDDPGTLVLSPLSTSVLEPEDGTSVFFPFTVKRTGKAPLAAIPVGVLLTPFASTATDGADFVFTPGTLNFAAGETEKTFEVEILGDATGCEGLETVGLSIEGLGALPAKVPAGRAVLGIADRSVSFVGPFSAAGTLSTTGPKGTCSWNDGFTGTVVVNVSCAGTASNLATVRATRVLNQGVPSGPGLACPSRSEPLLFSIPVEETGSDFLGTLAGNPTVEIDGSRSGNTAIGNLTFTFTGAATGTSAGTFTATKQ